MASSYVGGTIRGPRYGTTVVAAPAATPPRSVAGQPGTYTSQSSPFGGRYTLEMDPEVVAAKYYEKQGLADLASAPGPSGGGYSVDSSSLEAAIRNQQMGIQRLDYMLGLNKGNLALSNVDAQRGIVNALAGRNMLRSGEKPFLQGRQQQSYAQNLDLLQHKDVWAREDLAASVQNAQAAVAAARANANAAYANAQADYQRGITISKRELHDKVIDAYVSAYQRVIENPALYLGADANFDPRQFLAQVPH